MLTFSVSSFDPANLKSLQDETFTPPAVWLGDLPLTSAFLNVPPPPQIH